MSNKIDVKTLEEVKADSNRSLRGNTSTAARPLPVEELAYHLGYLQSAYKELYMKYAALWEKQK